MVFLNFFKFIVNYLIEIVYFKNRTSLFAALLAVLEIHVVDQVYCYFFFHFILATFGEYYVFCRKSSSAS